MIQKSSGHPASPYKWFLDDQVFPHQRIWHQWNTLQVNVVKCPQHQLYVALITQQSGMTFTEFLFESWGLEASEIALKVWRVLVCWEADIIKSHVPVSMIWNVTEAGILAYRSTSVTCHIIRAAPGAYSGMVPMSSVVFVQLTMFGKSCLFANGLASSAAVHTEHPRPQGCICCSG